MATPITAICDDGRCYMTEADRINSGDQPEVLMRRSVI